MKLSDEHWLKVKMKEYGLPVNLREEFASEVRKHNEKVHVSVRKKDWKYLLTPLKRAISGLQANSTRWRADADRAPLYGAYLHILVAARNRIQALERTNLLGETIPALAAKETQQNPDAPITNSGMHWQDWIPEKQKNKVRVAFDTFNAAHLGKHLSPFTSTTVQTPNERRWNMMQLKLLVELSQPGVFGLEECRFRSIALEQLENRGARAICPMVDNWQELLPKEDQIKYAQFIREYLARPSAPAPVQDRAADAAYTRRAAKAASQAKWRASKRMRKEDEANARKVARQQERDDYKGNRKKGERLQDVMRELGLSE